MIDSKVTLLDLPNELLLHILSFRSVLFSRDIYNVALLSTRFRSLALPLFLANESIPDPENETSLYVIEWYPKHVASAGRPDALSALNISTHISRINRFRCFFQDPDAKSFRNTFQQAFQLSDAVQRTSKFVKKLDGIGIAEIYLVWDPYFVIRERNINYVPFSELKRWTDAFGSMLNLIVERGCTSLTVQYDPSILPPFHFRSGGPMKKALSYLSHNVLRREGQSSDLHWEFERPTHEDKTTSNEADYAPLLSSSAQAIKSVTSLSMHSPVLLLPPFVNWTLSLLRTHSNLTSISFAHISFSKGVWSTVLPFIADAVSDRLKELSFFRNCPHLDPSDLLHFLGRLPNLTHLSIDRTFRTRFQEIKPAKTTFSTIQSSAPTSHSLPKFPHVHTLKAPVELVSLLLGPRPFLTKDHITTPLPSLRNLTVYPCSLLIHPPSYVQSSLVVNDLLQRVKSQPRPHDLCLTLDAQMEFTDFGPVTRYLETINTRMEFQRTLFGTLSEEDIKKLTENGSLPHISFDHIQHLLLYRFNLRYPDHTPPALCLWLKTLFPNVERLTFTCRLDAHPQQDVHMDNDTIEWLIKELREVCHGVRILVVGKITYKLWESLN
ncbi:hypothetical protein BDZ97DRAFT_1798776 [Flammula alnicola]|nr:hypothetical protein BDZ97DRAFT_1798776 [Flammula alnicola]